MQDNWTDDSLRGFHVQTPMLYMSMSHVFIMRCVRIHDTA